MSDVSASLLSVYNLQKDYHTPSGRLSVLKNINFSMESGEMTFIMGRSGSGKSTFLHLLGGLDKPSGGKILFEGENLTAMSENKMAKLRNRRLGFVFQFYHLLPELTLYENVMLPTLIARRRKKQWVKEVIRRVKLSSRQDHYPSELSGGEQQRAAIARALVNRPSLVLCDEPTGNLDSETSKSIMELIQDLNRQEGQAFLIVTHDDKLAAQNDKVFQITNGELGLVD